MADMPDEATPSKPALGDADFMATCGVIMPISATTNFSREHWARVQTLVHRGIRNAGFAPANVWENSATDRISERVIGNVFQNPIAVSDISDMNANVMLELGLRLSSKKPTVVICTRGGDIPFDVRDFEVVMYPADLNILDMETFFSEFEHALKTKHASFLRHSYKPFLGEIIVEVLEPEERPVPFERLILSRLDQMERRLTRDDRRSDSSPDVTDDSLYYRGMLTITSDQRESLASAFSKESLRFTTSVAAVGAKYTVFDFRISTVDAFGRPVPFRKLQDIIEKVLVDPIDAEWKIEPE